MWPFFLCGYWCSAIGKCSTTNSCRQFSDANKYKKICNATIGERYYCDNYKIINDKNELSTIYNGIYCSSFMFQESGTSSPPGAVRVANCDGGYYFCMDNKLLYPPATPKKTPKNTIPPATPKIFYLATLPTEICIDYVSIVFCVLCPSLK